jgi:hypothetical protein
MNAIGLTVLVLAVTGFGWLVWTLIAKEREKERALEQFAMERGWTYTKGGKNERVYAIQGSEGGMSWILESFQGSHNRTGRTVWKAADPPLTGGVVFIGSKALAALLKNPIGLKLARWGLQMVAGGDEVSKTWNRLVEGYQEVETGDPDFSAVYAVLATDPGQALKLITGEARRAMLEWEGSHKVGRASQGRFGVTWSEAGLSLTWSGSALQQPDDIAGFVAMALRLRPSVRSGW